MNSKNIRTGGQLVSDALQVQGADSVFCVPGESYLEVLDALYDARNAIRVISCRHEHGASNMAEAYGKLTGKPGICMVTRGPGACNASIGVHTAFQDSTPMILFIGQVGRQHLGREAFQEVDYVQMFTPLAKAVEQIEAAEDVPAAVARAYRTALSGRPGPVVLALPEDMLRESCEAPVVEAVVIESKLPGVGEMERLHHILGDSERPLMLVGGGGWSDQARADILAFAEANNLPTCCSFRRHDLFDNDHHNFVGEMGIAPNPKLIERFKQADLLLVVGARLGEMTTQGYTLLGEPAPIQNLIHVHTDAQELGKVYKPDLAIHAGMDAFAAAARKLAPVESAHREADAKAGREEYLEGRIPDPYDGALNLGQLMAVIDEMIGEDGIITVDAGNGSGWPQRFIPIGAKRRLLGPTSGAMGYGVPAALAAKAVYPERTVVCCVGDGCFGMTGQEISTGVKDGLKPIILIFNNAMYGTIRLHQERRHPDRVIATDLDNPDYAAVAKASGAFGETIESTEEFRPAFERALRSNLLAVLDLRVDPDLITTRTTLSAIAKN
ncbi:MAG: thiamine pyrophosphate-binding protein [Rhodospirillaceae bacterium]|nr:thiamine pyrophosphate-binding protein [Rhodospirillaceae bacterium]MBL6941103.1 thiamine pyrophosphate-binding protein [Rhodospirillales bacterium]